MKRFAVLLAVLAPSIASADIFYTTSSDIENYTTETVEVVDVPSGLVAESFNGITVVSGTPYTSYYNAEVKHLRFGTRGSSSWSLESPDPTEGSGINSSLVYHDGVFHIGHVNRVTNEVRHTFGNSGNWTTNVVADVYDNATANASHSDVSMAVNPVTGNLEMLFFNEGDLTVNHTVYDGSNWSTPQHVWDAELSSEGRTTSFAIGADGTRHATRHQLSTGLSYMRDEGSGWSAETVNPSGAAGWYASLTLDSNGTPWIAYYSQSSAFPEYETDYALLNKREGDDDWGDPITLDANFRSGYHISLDFLSDDTAVAAFHQAIGGTEDAWDHVTALKVATFDGQAVDLRTILSDPNGVIDYGVHVRLFVDENDVLHMAYDPPVAHGIPSPTSLALLLPAAAIIRRRTPCTAASSRLG